jgi:hypothetical protein
MRFFGPQATPESMRVSQVEFTDGLPIDLVSDLVVRAGQRLSFSGHGGTLRVGKHQLQVHRGGALELMRLGVAESEASSAVIIEGVAAFANCTFVDCSARLNAVSECGLESRGGAIAVIGGGRLTMRYCSMRRNAVRDGIACGGGALLVSACSSAELVATELSLNNAIGGRIGSNGGAVCVRDRSSLRLVRSTLAQNVADGQNATSFYAYGGAVYLYGDSIGEVAESVIMENVATEALSVSCGGAIYVENSKLVVAMSKVNHNVAEGAVYCPSGGAICMETSAAEFADTDLLENVVHGGKYANAGGPNVHSSPCVAMPCCNNEL